MQEHFTIFIKTFDFKLPVSRFLAINIEGKIGQLTVRRTSSFIKREFKKSANQKQESSVVAMFVNGSGRNEQSLQRTFHRKDLYKTCLFRFDLLTNMAATGNSCS
jgi:hypothetical protein